MNSHESCGSRPRTAPAVVSKVRLSTEIEPGMRAALIDLAYERRTTFSHLIRAILADALAAAGSKSE